MIFRNLLLAFQLENYHPSRFLKFSYTHGKFRFIGSKRQKLDWTKKAILLFIGSVCFFCLLLLGGIWWGFEGWNGVSLRGGRFLVMMLLVVGYPLLLVFTAFLTVPLELFLKRRIITQAKQKIAQFPDLLIIGVTGSYGKTSVKEILKAMLESRMKVIATP